MKKYVVMAGLMCGLVAGAGADVILVDFGNDSSYRGVTQSGADNNGNFWNSVWSGAFYSGLVNVSNATTTINLGFTSAPGTDSFNGPAGATSDPVTPAELAAVRIDAPALNLLGGSEAAAIDYYVNSTFQIQNLDADFTYDLTFFGSRKFTEEAITRYAIYDVGFSNVLQFADLDVGSGDAHNSNTVVTIAGLSPQPDGIIYVGFGSQSGTNSGYLNAMQINVIPEPAAASLVLLGSLVVGVLAHRSRA